MNKKHLFIILILQWGNTLIIQKAYLFSKFTDENNWS